MLTQLLSRHDHPGASDEEQQDLSRLILKAEGAPAIPELTRRSIDLEHAESNEVVVVHGPPELRGAMITRTFSSVIDWINCI